MDTWENLQARLFHLGWLGEELPAFVATPGGAWLFRQICREAQTVAQIAADYVAECERAGLTGPNGETPTVPANWRRTSGPHAWQPGGAVRDDTAPDDLTTGAAGPGGMPADTRPEGEGGGAA